MEPHGTLALFHRSLDYNLLYKYLVSNKDSKTFSLLTQEVYGETRVKKLDCWPHPEMPGTALSNLKVQHRAQKLSDVKTIGGAGCLTDSLINSLQNYYGSAIRTNKENLDLMVKAVQATLLTTTVQTRGHDTTSVHQEKIPGVVATCAGTWSGVYPH